MKTLVYIYGTEQEIKIGAELYFGQLWNGDGDGQELLESGSICVGEDEDEMPVVVGFKIVEEHDDILNAVVHVTDIY